ncbi:MAG: glycerate kinase [Actinomycetota bacterium]|nr:glycerate kinase [Actinomycetota bacterium]
MDATPILSHDATGPQAGMRVLVAPSAFKGSLSSTQAAEAMSAGVHAALPGAVVDVVLMADGGDGSIDALVRAGFTAHEVEARGPTLVPGQSAIAVTGARAAVELASTCGLTRLPGGRLEPLASSTHGLGDAIRAALDLGIDELLLCVGGSASTDGGAGMLQALGAVLLDATGRPVQACGGTLGHIASLDLSRLDARLAGCRVTVATDVSSPLTGNTGAAAVFGPQKGASPAQVRALEEATVSWAGVLAGIAGRDVAGVSGSGAAGGTAAAALAVLGAEIAPGAEAIAEATGLRAAVARASLVVTGEGSFDEQSLLGKGPSLVLRWAGEAARPAALVCGSIGLPADRVRAAGATAWAALDDGADLPDAISRAAQLLPAATARAVASAVG